MSGGGGDGRGGWAMGSEREEEKEEEKEEGEEKKKEKAIYLLLDGWIPPAVEKEDVVGSSQIQPHSARFE